MADAYWGIPTVNNCSDVEVSGCNIRRARFGAQALQSSAGAYDTRNIRYHGNTYTGCPVGFRTAHPRNASIIRETIDQSEVMAYGYTYPFNNLLFVDVATGRVFKLTPERQLSIVLKENSFGASGLAVHKDGRIFIASVGDMQRGSVRAIEPNGTREQMIVAPDAGFLVNDLVFDNQGGFYFTDSRGNSEIGRAHV